MGNDIPNHYFDASNSVSTTVLNNLHYKTPMDIEVTFAYTCYNQVANR
ncbi:hypothetical protein JCM19233_3852 [Vibrio astriarenae]|nr:hypothetical protein JCM19233_3852 [Vibrio sp. C7]